MKKEIDINKYVVSVLEPLNLKGETLDEVINIIEREDKPKDQPAPAPIRLWCAKDRQSGTWLTRGKIYETPENKITFDDGWKTLYEGTDRFSDGTKLNTLLFPLAKRPAKEGEWARNIITGEVIKVIAGAKQTQSDGVAYGGKDGYLHYMPNTEYEVIENYQGEYEQPEELLQGAVVCTRSNNDTLMIRFKKYIAKDGRITFENGEVSRPYKSVDDFNFHWGAVKIARLIEEGEK